MGTIVVTDYDPAWPALFEQIAAVLWPAVAGIASIIEHVGSTAVPGLAAKPIIDVDIVVPSAEAAQLLVGRLEPLGYTHRGDLGIAGREAFKQHNDLPPHHLYVCVENSVGLRNHLAVRDYLRTHPDAVTAYGALKKQLATKFSENIDSYVDGKTDLLLEMLAASELSPEQLAAIEQSNRLA